MAVGVRGQVGLLAVVEALVVLARRRRRRHCWAAGVAAAAILHGLPAAVAVASVRARRRRTSPHSRTVYGPFWLPLARRAPPRQKVGTWSD